MCREGMGQSSVPQGQFVHSTCHWDGFTTINLKTTQTFKTQHAQQLTIAK